MPQTDGHTPDRSPEPGSCRTEAWPPHPARPLTLGTMRALMSHHARLQATTGWPAGRLGDRLAVLAGRLAGDLSVAGDMSRETETEGEPRLQVKAIKLIRQILRCAGTEL